MLRLDHDTPPEWVRRVERRPLELLSDHAHCELKAAASVRALIARHPERRELVRSLELVEREELEHFERVVAELEARGGFLGPREPSPYAAGLHAAAAATRGDGLLDRLVVAGLIEARSLERFHLLERHARDRSLARLYRGLLASEAAHRVLFGRLARFYFSEQAVAQREHELGVAEGRLVARLPCAARVHSGLGARAPAAGP